MTALTTDAFAMTDAAAKRVAFLLKQEDQPGARLRIAVSGGGCAGFQYGFSFDAETTEDDRIIVRDGIELVMDETSLDILAGGQLDWVEDLVGSAFKITNPQATSSCGCGNSFSV